MADTMKCHECGGHMARAVKPMEFAYKGHKVIMDQPGWYCVACGEGVHSGEDMKVSDHAVDILKGRYHLYRHLSGEGDCR